MKSATITLGELHAWRGKIDAAIAALTALTDTPAPVAVPRGPKPEAAEGAKARRPVRQGAAVVHRGRRRTR